MEHPQPTFAYLVSTIRDRYPRFAYIHVVEPRVSGFTPRTPLKGESNDFLRSIWKGPESEKNGSVYISAGGFNAQNALDVSEATGDLVAFGRFYISNVSYFTFFVSSLVFKNENFLTTYKFSLIFP